MRPQPSVATVDLPPQLPWVPVEESPPEVVGEVTDGKFSLRYATPDDIERIVDVDMQSFSGVYGAYDASWENLRTGLVEKFQARLNTVGGAWMPVLERDGEIVGFMTCCPTSKEPEDFVSWEDMTDNGTLKTTYDPEGDNIYVVTLSVLPEGTAGKDMLFAHQIGKMLREGYNLAFFESRLPGLRAWLHEQAIDETTLAPDVLEATANEYFNQTVEEKGQQVYLDRLIRLYQRIGCKMLRVVPDAYRDTESLNFGVVCVYDGENLFNGADLPTRIPENRLTRWALGVGLQRLAKNPKNLNGIFSDDKTATDDVAVASPESRAQQGKQWLRQYKGRLILGAALASTAATLATAPTKHLVAVAEQEAPWAAGGMAAMEALWIGGAAVALGSVGVKTKNPLKIKSYFQDIGDKARDNRAFRAGMIINTAGAVGEFIIPVAAVCPNLPVSSWGILAPSVADVAATIAVRTAIWRSVSKAKDEQ